MTGPGRAGFGFAVALGLVLAGAAVFCWPWLSGAVTVPWDSKAHFYPQFAFLARSLAEGWSPFWNPHIFAGWPQVADPQSLIFAPGFLLLAALDPTPGFVVMDAVVFAALLGGSAAILALFRDRGWAMPGAVVAALCFAFGGGAAWRIQHVGQVLSLSMLPVAIWLLARALERRSPGWGLAAGAAAGVMVLGRDQVALMGVYLLAGMVLAHLLAGHSVWGRLRRSLLPLGAGAVGGALVAAGPVMLSMLLAADSNRPEFGFAAAGAGSLHPAALITAAVPDLFAHGNPAIEFWGPGMLVFGALDLVLAQNMIAVYAGILPCLAVLLVGVGRGVLAEPGIRFFALALVAVTLYGLGWYTPVFRLAFEWLPGVSLFRRPSDATFLIGFLLALNGGYALNRWLDGTMKPAGFWVQTLQGLMLAAVFVVLPLGFALHADRLAEATGPMLLALAFAAGGLMVAGLARWLWPRPGLAAGLLAAFVTADLVINNGPNESTALPPAEYAALLPGTGDPVVRFLTEGLARHAAPDRRDRVELDGIGFHWPNIGMVHGFDHSLGYNPLRLRVYEQATGAQDQIAGPDQRKFAPLFRGYGSPLVDLLGIRYVASTAPLESLDRQFDGRSLPEVARFGPVRIHENPEALPRVMLVDGVRPADFAAMAAGGGWPEGFAPTREVLLEGVPPRAPGEGSPGTARLLRYANTEVLVEVQASRGAYLLLNDVWHRWWRVTVDGRPVAMLRANVLFRAVPVPPGRHVVRFGFHPFAGAWQDLRVRWARG